MTRYFFLVTSLLVLHTVQKGTNGSTSSFTRIDIVSQNDPFATIFRASMLHLPISVNNLSVQQTDSQRFLIYRRADLSDADFLEKSLAGNLQAVT